MNLRGPDELSGGPRHRSVTVGGKECAVLVGLNSDDVVELLTRLWRGYECAHDEARAADVTTCTSAQSWPLPMPGGDRAAACEAPSMRVTWRQAGWEAGR